MSDQGWMVDDGTCGPCLHGLCYRCAKPQELEWDDPWVAPDEELLP